MKMDTTTEIDLDEKVRELREEREAELLLRGVRWLAIGVTVVIPVSATLGRFVFA